MDVKPVRLPLRLGVTGNVASFGFGDRIGLATSGHVMAMKRAGYGIRPVYAQQSIREMARTGRSPQTVIVDAVNAAFGAGYRREVGADADHVKTAAEADRCLAAGFVTFTLDLSDCMDNKADRYTSTEVAERLRMVAPEIGWIGQYRGKTIKLTNGTMVSLDAETCNRVAAKYAMAISHANRLAGHIKIEAQKARQDYEFELSVDETANPTTLAEHYIVADQCLRKGLKLIAIAPRFVGDFEKGVDYKGDLAALEKNIADHAAIADTLGAYKLSLHSGSDKLSVYGMLAQLTKGRYHVKTAGTSYLEALRVAARKDPTLFRFIVDFARAHYEADKATYHVSATLASAPPQDQVADDTELEKAYLGLWSSVPKGQGFTEPGRQILHCTFGSVLTDPELGAALLELLKKHASVYEELLGEHFERHLLALQGGMK